MNIQQIEAAIEAILFASGNAVSQERIAAAAGVDTETVRKILNSMTEKRNAENSGLKIIRLSGSYQMVTKEEYAVQIRAALDMHRNAPLSAAAMETLAIIAYNQPVTRGYIERVRGVDSSGIVSSLEAKELIEERGRLDVPGRPILYGTTLNFLRCFGLKSINELPKVEGMEPTEEETAV